MRDDWATVIARAEAEAPFLRRLIGRRGDVLEALRAQGLAGALAQAAAEAAADPDARRALRRQRQAVALATALADLNGAPLETVTRALSDFADQALDRAITAVFAQRGAAPDGFVALALGKQGSRELNYSSDIDPILLFDPDTLPRGACEDPVEAAVRITRGLLDLLQTPDGDGYVMRVDLRLRPASEVSPLAVPVAAAIQHYESSALPWERAAFIRARAAAGDIGLGERFLAEIRPFVWRRSLDYGAIEEIRLLSRRIRDHYAQGQQVGPGYDVKRGRGGIREVEFFAQIHQLIHGGRDPALRVAPTLEALAALAAAGRIDAQAADVLAAAYRRLRTVEHRLQMIEDQQTHRLPVDEALLDAVARLDGMADGAALVADLRTHSEAVGALYDAIEREGGEALAAGEGLGDALAKAGFAANDSVAKRIEAWRAGTARTTRSPAARAALERVLPALLAALGRAPAPVTAFNRFDDLLERLPSAVNLFRLLDARPQLLALLADVLSHAPVLAGALARRASLLDGLLDASALALPPDAAALAAAFARGEAGEDYQALLDRVRAEVGERRFQLGLQIVAGASDPLAVGAGYGRVAEAAMEVLAAAAIAEFERAHGRVPGGELLIVALGRFGGGVLTHASDLDIIFLFTGDFLAESDGPRPLGATTYFNRLAQRVVAALSVQTANGPLYPVDTRLRPSGGQGLLAVSLDSFARYEAEEAWTWEHMALTRARPVFGSAEGRAAASEVIGSTLRRARDVEALRADAAKMRADIATHKPPAGPLDVKLIAGGLVDVEFAVHLLQLTHRTALEPEIGAAARALAAEGHLAAGFVEAMDLLTRMLIVLRLVAEESSGEPAETSRLLVARACGAEDWDALTAAYAAARETIGSEWRRVAELG